MEFTIANALTTIDKYKVENAKKMGMTFNNLCNSCTNVESIPKDQYEARLKADMVAELKEIREEVLALYRDRPLNYNHRQRTEFCDKVLFILDKKISELEGKK